MNVKKCIEALKQSDPNFSENDLYEAKQQELEQALKSRKWVNIQRIEAELESLKKAGYDKLQDREAIMSESQKLRYSFLKNATPEEVKNTMQMIEVIDCIKSLYSDLPDDSEDFEIIKQTVLHQARDEGCSDDELLSLQEYIDAIYRVEMKKRKKKR